MRFRSLVLPILLIGLVGLGACAPQRTNTVYSAAAIGRDAQVSRGVIVGMREVQVSGRPTGIGGAAGAAAGGIGASFIGGDPRSNILAAIGGAIVGGLIGSTIEGQVARGSATEFLIQEEGMGVIAVVQSNEDRFGVGERVLIMRGDRTRLVRA